MNMHIMAYPTNRRCLTKSSLIFMMTGGWIYAIVSDDKRRQLQITNKLLLALYFKEDADGNIIAAQPSDIQSANILK